MRIGTLAGVALQMSPNKEEAGMTLLVSLTDGITGGPNNLMILEDLHAMNHVIPACRGDKFPLHPRQRKINQPFGH